MAFEFDHPFICASMDGPEAARLTEFGLTEGAPNTHPGQGTSCRRFFFLNGYLELLWVNDAIEAQSEVIKPTRLWERWVGRARGVCPFGVGFRPKTQHDGTLPFNS